MWNFHSKPVGLLDNFVNLQKNLSSIDSSIGVTCQRWLHGNQNAQSSNLVKLWPLSQIIFSLMTPMVQCRTTAVPCPQPIALKLANI